jgi:hypothetical protein
MMTPGETDEPHDEDRNAPRGANILLAGILLVAAFYLITEHGGHLFGVLPFLLLLCCPLMHLFVHHGHGGDWSPDGGADAGRYPNQLGELGHESQ